MSSRFRVERSPDFDNLRRTLLRQGPPGPVPFIELFADPGIIQMLLGEEIGWHSLLLAELDLAAGRGDPARGRAALDLVLRFCYENGYDYVWAWTGLGFLTVQTPWGAFPGHTLDDIQSGIGFVHNTYMFDRVERTVIEAPFRPFPRNLLHGSLSLLPKPPWFVTNKKADVLGRLLTQFQHRPGFLKIPRIFLNALLG